MNFMIVSRACERSVSGWFATHHRSSLLLWHPLSAPLPPLNRFSTSSTHAPLQSHAQNILFICIHRRPRTNGRKKKRNNI